MLQGAVVAQVRRTQIAALSGAEDALQRSLCSTCRPLSHEHVFNQGFNRQQGSYCCFAIHFVLVGRNEWREVVNALNQYATSPLAKLIICVEGFHVDDNSLDELCGLGEAKTQRTRGV